MWNQYLKPETVSDALELVNYYGKKSRLVAGGTDLILALTEGRVPPCEALIDISNILELRAIRTTNGWIEIGACASLSDLICSPVIQYHAPILIAAAKQIAGPQIRNLATLGGNIVNASPAADMVPPLLVHDAVVCTKSIDLTGREIPLQDFMIGPRQVNLYPGELVKSIRLPFPPDGVRYLFRKVQPRRSMAIAILNLAILIKIENNRINHIRIAMGAVAPTPSRIRSVEQKLTNQTLKTVKNSST
jgi:CO/xanthine dehydrogenase FAD-binding subunit